MRGRPERVVRIVVEIDLDEHVVRPIEDRLADIAELRRHLESASGVVKDAISYYIDYLWDDVLDTLETILSEYKRRIVSVKIERADTQESTRE